LTKQFVKITGNEYAFYMGNAHVITIKADFMPAALLEEYRKNHRHIFRDLEPDPSVA